MKNNPIQRYTVTAALPYANGPVHIGHLAGVYIPADIFVRYLRSKSEEVVFICGSDEHGVAITVRAKKENISPQAAVNKYHFMIKKSFERFNISFDHYSRTSSKIHYQTASMFFNNLYKKKVFLEKRSQQYYDKIANQFLADRYIFGTCPDCQYEHAYGDQCEKCGSTLSPQELINPKSSLSGEPPIFKTTTHWYLPLNKYELFLKKWILIDHKFDWKSNVYGQAQSWLNAGLKPRSVTRDLEWGIPIPIKGITGKVLYVWFDAPIGYISSTIEWAKIQGKNWETYWKDPTTSLINFIGKDNIVFHCIIFPTMLKAHGDYILPQNISSNEFLTLENQKISTSRNWAVWLHEYLEDFPDKEDVLRYVLTTNMPENKDTNFSWQDFQKHNNSELVGILGNFIHRISILTEKYCYKQVPIPSSTTFTDQDGHVLKELEQFPDSIGKLLLSYRFRDAVNEFMKIARMGNKYLTQEMPWKTYHTNPDRTYNIIYISLQIAAMIAQISRPFLPKTSEKLMNLFSMQPIPWDKLKYKKLLHPGTVIGKVELLFQKIDNIEIEKQQKKLMTSLIKRERVLSDQ